MANILFNLRKNESKKPEMIYLTYYFGKDKLAYPTKLKILPKYWNKEKMRVRDLVEAIGKDAINARLDEFEVNAKRFCVEQTAKGKTITKTMLREQLDTFTGKRCANSINTLHGFIEQFILDSVTRVNDKTGKIISYKVQREYERTYNLLKEYEAKTLKGRELDFVDINLEFYQDFTAYLQRCNLAANTIAHKIQTLKVFLNDATERKINDNTEYKSKKFKAILEKADTIYLNDEELKQIAATDCKNNTLNRVRDLFLIGAYTGLRFSDFTRITKDHIKNDTIKIEQQKTGARVEIPVHPVVKEIWERYGERLPETISNQRFNDYIKEVCKIAGIDGNEEINQTKGGLRVHTTYKKYELVTSHTARRSFATNQYLGGFPAISLMKITGHQTEKAFMGYIRVTPKEYAEQLREHWREKGEFLKIAK